MAAGEREWDERPAAMPAGGFSEPQKGLGCGFWALIVFAVPVAFGILFLGAWGLFSLFG